MHGSQVLRLLWGGSTESMEVCGETEQQMLVWISLLVVGMEGDRSMKHLGVKINWAWVGG